MGERAPHEQEAHQARDGGRDDSRHYEPRMIAPGEVLALGHVQREHDGDLRVYGVSKSARRDQRPPYAAVVRERVHRLLRGSRVARARPDAVGQRTSLVGGLDGVAPRVAKHDIQPLMQRHGVEQALGVGAQLFEGALLRQGLAYQGLNAREFEPLLSRELQSRGVSLVRLGWLHLS